MNPAAENALRAVARKCRAEILAAVKGKHKSEHDSIITTRLDKHTKTITALPPNRYPAKLWLSYYVRLVDKEIRE